MSKKLIILCCAAVLIPLEWLFTVVVAPAGRADLPQPGQHFSVTMDNLPAPYEEQAFSNPPSFTGEEPDPTKLLVANGFTVSVFADNLVDPRNMIVTDDGALIVAEETQNRVLRLVDSNNDGVVDQRQICGKNWKRPYGLADYHGALYIADTQAVWKLQTCDGKRQQITPDGIMGEANGHTTRNLIFHPRQDRFFVAIGSKSNMDEESQPRATIQEFKLDGTPVGTFASGLRNPVGLAFVKDTLWTVVNERDLQGDQLVPDYLTSVNRGDFFGWPYTYIGDNPQPEYAQQAAKLKGKVQVPDLLFQAHSAPLGMVFYNHDHFGPTMKGHAFVALHGSWNASVPRGYMVARIPFIDGQPQGHYEAFLTGFWVGKSNPASLIGRPAALAVGVDGSLLIADDWGGVIWRVDIAP